MSAQEIFDKVLELMRRPAALAYVRERLNWDRRTQASNGSLAADEGMMEVIARETHDTFVTPEIGSALELAMSNRDGLGEGDRLLLERLDLSFRRAYVIPSDLAARRGAVEAKAEADWLRAREAKDFDVFAPSLFRVLDVVQEEAGHLDPVASSPDGVYTTMLQRFEPGMTSERMFEVFDLLKMEMLPFVRETLDVIGDRTFPFVKGGAYKVESQLALVRNLASMLGYDFSRGHLALTTHPFMATVGPHDVRITTRAFDDDFRGCLFGTIHEAGHGMFEQGRADNQWLSLPYEMIYSLGIHESQSRLWECHVGRSMPFLLACANDIAAALPFLALSTPAEVYPFVCQVRRHHKRVEADELQYFLHVLLRIELERDLLSGKVYQASDVRDAFAAKMEEYLGVTPKDDVEGVLQDVHWSHGAVGYFGTYVLGSLAAAQLFHVYAGLHPDYESEWRERNFSGLLSWLRPLHAVGLVTDLDSFLVRATGEPLNPQYWIDYAKGKYTHLRELLLQT